MLSQTCVFQGGFDKKHQVFIVPKLDYLLYIDRALYPSCTARRITAVSCYASRRSVSISRHMCVCVYVCVCVCVTYASPMQSTLLICLLNGHYVRGLYVCRGEGVVGGVCFAGDPLKV